MAITREDGKMNVLVPVRQTEHKDEIDLDTFKRYADIGFAIMMQLFGHKVEYVKSNITKEGIEKNKKMWEKAAEELNERRIMKQKRKIAELKEQIAKNGNGKVQLQECDHTSYECMPGCCECEWIEQKKGN